MRKTQGFAGWSRMLVVLSLLASPWAMAQTSANLSSRFLAKGEYARLEITTVGREPDFSPATPAVQDVRIETGRMGMVSRTTNNQDLEFSYEFAIASDVVGRHVIPPVTLVVAGNRVQSPPVEFWVFDPDKLQLSEVEAGGRMIPYYAGFHTAKPTAYEGETMPAEIKIYVPALFARDVLDWGVPEFERDGVTSWRFEPNDRRDILPAYIGGQQYYALAYPSNLAPSRSGRVGIGPATLRLTSAIIVNDGFPRRSQMETYLKIPKLEFDAIPLPGGAPDGFENAIGQFTIESNTAKTELTEGESLALNILVRGRGNLDALKAPRLSDVKGWKIYDPISIPRGDERRQISGIATFHQGLLPMEMKSTIPSFKLVYFDPDDATYKTTASEPIQIIMTPSTKAPGTTTGPPPALAMPIERMNDILALVTPKHLTIPAVSALPSWIGHAIGALAALLLIIKAAWMKISPGLKKDPLVEQKNMELARMAKIPTNDAVSFLKAAGAYVERWHGANTEPALREILAERDRVCFRAEKDGDTSGAKSRRDEILRTLRKAVVPLIIFISTLSFSGHAQGAEDITTEAAKAYDDSKYEDAIKLWQSAGDYKQLSPDTLYNIGNASYRMGSPGHAALYYRRALVKDPSHAEARQNLRFLERKYGSIAVQYANYQHALAKIPLAGWKNILWAGAWLTALSILIFPATRPGARFRIAAAIFLVIGPLAISIGALGWRYYPNDSIFAPLEKQAVIVVPKAILHADAARTSPEIIDAPEGSLCEILRISGKWAYVSFATKTRGWVPVSSIEKLIPDKSPGVPKVTRPTGDDSNA